MVIMTKNINIITNVIITTIVIINISTIITTTL